MHESMTSQKIKKLGAGGPSLVGGPKLLVGGPWPPPPAPPLATGLPPGHPETAMTKTLKFVQIQEYQQRDASSLRADTSSY